MLIQNNNGVALLNPACPSCAGCAGEGCQGENRERGCSGCSQRGKCGSCAGVRGTLSATNWLDGISDDRDYDVVEVQFKNTRKGYYSNPSGLDLHPGDMVVVEAAPGHDVGVVSLVGRLVRVQMKKMSLRNDYEIKRVFRRAKDADLERFREARAREVDTMIRSRRIAADLNLDMKIGDVEYQGDGAKAIFYYIADERVDFRKLIRVLADTFKVRIEMKQIGARQEAGRIGGIGPCGRPLCCATWMTRFASVGTGAARTQDLSLNPQKLAGQCAKLKCCLNFEIDSYAEARMQLPNKDVTLETKDATYYLFKTDILARMVTYSTARNQPVNLVAIPAARAFEIIALNKTGVKVDSLKEADTAAPVKKTDFVELVGQDSLTRFDKNKKKRKKKANADKNPKPEKAAKPDSSAKPGKTPGSEKSDKPAKPAKKGKKGGNKSKSVSAQPSAPAPIRKEYSPQ